jgi:hypothetical protein
MSDLTTFEPWPKIPRLRRGMVITEKIDGSNGQICVRKRVGHVARGPYQFDNKFDGDLDHTVEGDDGQYLIRAASRKRWLTPGVKGGDNFGFAHWVRANADVLVRTLGVGRHYGEWWGSGIQRGYNLDVKRFSLFNAYRWRDQLGPVAPSIVEAQQAGVQLDVVPVLYTGRWSDEHIEKALANLREHGSWATVESFHDPEGIIILHEASRHHFKVLLQNDELPKGVTTKAESDAAEADAA